MNEDYKKEMEELAEDTGWIRYVDALEASSRLEVDEMENMEENKAKKFARMIMEA